MSRVDQELAKAVEEAEAAAGTGSPPDQGGMAVPPGEPPRRPQRNLGLLIALLVMGGGILALVFTSFEDAAIYSKGVDELVKERQLLAARAAPCCPEVDHDDFAAILAQAQVVTARAF